MPLAKVAPIATRIATSNNEAGLVLPNAIAAVEAMKRFDGPINGIRFNPKDPKKMKINSIIASIFGFSPSFSKEEVITTLISASV